MGLPRSLKNLGPGPGHSFNYQVCQGAGGLDRVTGQDRNVTPSQSARLGPQLSESLLVLTLRVSDYLSLSPTASFRLEISGPPAG